MTKALEAGAISEATHNRLLDAARQKHEAVAAAANKQTTAETSLASQLTTQARNLAGAYLGIATVTKSIKLAIDAEQATAQFELLSGSVNNSKVLLGELREFANVSPLSLGGVRDAAKTLLSFQVPVREVSATLKQLGDIAGGNQQRFDSLALAFAQAAGKGRLTGDNLKQMVEAGFNPLNEISKRTGESLGELTKRMEDGKISVQEMKDAFRTATEEGGTFHGMTEKLAETMGGKLAIAMANLEMAGIKLGQALAPLVIDMTEGFERGISTLDILIGMTEKMVDGFRMAAAFVKDIFSEGDLVHVNKLLDELQARDKARQDELESAALKRMRGIKDGYDAEKEDLSSITKMEKLAQQNDLEMEHELQLAKAKGMDKIREEAHKNDLEMIEALADAKDKAAKREASDWFRAQDAALDLAMKRFKNFQKIREDVAKGPGAGMELFGAEATKYLADLKNGILAAEAMPQANADERAIEEAKQQLEELKRQTELSRENKQQMESLIAAVKDNAFQRIR